MQFNKYTQTHTYLDDYAHGGEHRPQKQQRRDVALLPAVLFLRPSEHVNPDQNTPKAVSKPHENQQAKTILSDVVARAHTKDRHTVMKKGKGEGGGGIAERVQFCLFISLQKPRQNSRSRYTRIGGAEVHYASPFVRVCIPRGWQLGGARRPNFTSAAGCDKPQEAFPFAGRGPYPARLATRRRRMS